MGDVQHGLHDDSPVETTVYTIEAAIADALDRLAGRHGTGPAQGEDGVERWIWTGSRLVRASPEASESLRQREAMEQAELQRLQERQAAYRQQRRESYRRLASLLVAPLRPLWLRWRRV